MPVHCVYNSGVRIAIAILQVPRCIKQSMHFVDVSGADRPGLAHTVVVDVDVVVVVAVIVVTVTVVAVVDVAVECMWMWLQSRAM